MNGVMEVPQAVARTSPHHAETHQQPRVHRTGGLGGDALGDSAGSNPEEVTVGSWPGAARVGEVRAPLGPGEP
jgi:hypothetical protein